MTSRRPPDHLPSGALPRAGAHGTVPNTAAPVR